MIKNKIFENLREKLRAAAEENKDDKKLQSILEQLQLLIDINTAYTNAGKILYTSEAKNILEEYTKFQQECLDYVKTPENVPGKYYLKAALVPISSFISELSEAAEAKTQVTMEQVLFNDHLLKDIFVKDSGPEDREGYVAGSFKDESIKSPEDGLKAYKEIAEKIPGKLDEHLKRLTGDPKEPNLEAAFKARVLLMQEVLFENVKYPEPGEVGEEDPKQAISSSWNPDKIWKDWGIVRKQVDPGEMKSVPGDLLKEDMFREKLGYVLDDSVFSGNIKHFLDENSLGKKALQLLDDEVCKVGLGAKRIGISHEDMERLEFFQEAGIGPSFAFGSGGFLDDLKYTAESNGKTFDPEKHPAHVVFASERQIAKKALNYIQGKGEAPSLEDMKQYLGEVKKCLQSYSISDLMEPNINDVYGNMLSSVNILNQYYPDQLKDEISQLKQAVKDNVSRTFSGMIKIVLQDPDSPGYRNKIAKAQGTINHLLSDGYISTKQYEQFRILCMMQQPYSVSQLIKQEDENVRYQAKFPREEYIKNIFAAYSTSEEIGKSYAKIAVFGKMLFGELYYQQEAEEDLLPGEEIKHGPKELDDYLKTKNHDENSAKAILEFFDKLEKTPEIQGILSKRLMEIHEQLGDYEPDRNKIFEWPLDQLGLTEEEKSALTRKDDNYPAYIPLKNEILNINKAIVSGNSFLKERIPEVKRLCIACANYLYTQDPASGSKEYKLRFRAASKVVEKTLLPLILETKDKKEKNKYISLLNMNMIRNKTFRRNMITEARERLKEVNIQKGGAGQDENRELYTQMILFGTALDMKLKGKSVAGRIPKEMRQMLADQYKPLLLGLKQQSRQMEADSENMTMTLLQEESTNKICRDVIKDMEQTEKLRKLSTSKLMKLRSNFEKIRTKKGHKITAEEEKTYTKIVKMIGMRQDKSAVTENKVTSKRPVKNVSGREAGKTRNIPVK